MVAEIMPIGVTTSDLVSHLPEGTGASFTDVQTELRSLKKAVGGTNQILSVDTFTGDGSTTTFTMTDSAGDSSTLTVVIDGLVQEIGSYSVTNGTSLIFSQAPLLGSVIEVRALVRGDIISTELKTNEFVANGTTLDFTLSASAIKNNTFVYINGVYQFKSSYAVSDTTLTFSQAPPNNSVIEVMLVGFTTSIVATPAADSVGTSAIQDNAITTAKIADNSVTTAKIADDAVTAAKIASEPISVGITTVVTSASMTATVNTHVYVSAAGRTITLPASPTIGQRVLVTVGNFTDTVVGRNGSNIMSSASDFTMDAAYLSIQFIYTDATQGWVMS